MAARSGLNVRSSTYSKAAIYACPNHTDGGIHSDHGYLDTCDNPLGWHFGIAGPWAWILDTEMLDSGQRFPEISAQNRSKFCVFLSRHLGPESSIFRVHQDHLKHFLFQATLQ